MRLVLQRLRSPAALAVFYLDDHCCYYTSFCCCLFFPFAASVCGTTFPSHHHHQKNHTPHSPFSGCQPYFHCRFIHLFFFPSFILLSSSQPIICILHTCFSVRFHGTSPVGDCLTLVLLPERSISKSGFAFHSSFVPPPTTAHLTLHHGHSIHHPPSTIHHHLPSPIYHRRTPSRHRDSCCLLSLSPRTHSFSSLSSPFQLRYLFSSPSHYLCTRGQSSLLLLPNQPSSTDLELLSSALHPQALICLNL